MLFSLLILGCLTGRTSVGPANPMARYPQVMTWHQVWDGTGWKWTPADVCPVCFAQGRPSTPGCGDLVRCPNCGALVPETDWDQFNARRAWWLGWPGATWEGYKGLLPLPEPPPP